MDMMHGHLSTIHYDALQKFLHALGYLRLVATRDGSLAPSRIVECFSETSITEALDKKFHC